MSNAPIELATAPIDSGTTFSISASNNPPVYDLIILGGGAAALAAAAEAAQQGRHVALAAPRLGGEEPLDRARRLARAAILSRARGAAVTPTETAWHAWRKNVGEPRREDSPSDGLPGPAIEHIAGHAVFTGRDTVAIHGREVKFDRAIVALEARSELPTIEGLAAAGAIEAEAWANLSPLPARVLLLGAGAMVCEIAQALVRLDCEVHVVASQPSLLDLEPRELENRLQQQLLAEGVRLHVGWTCEVIETFRASKLVLVRQANERRKLFVDHVLVVGQRVPKLELFALAAAGIESTHGGIVIDDQLQTTNKRVFAIPPAADGTQRTALARVAARNALGPLRERFDATLLPRVVHTDPEIAELGTSLHAARQQGIDVELFRVMANESAASEQAWLGHATIWTARRNERLVGATLVGRGAHGLADQLSLVMAQGTTLHQLDELARAGRLASATLRQISAQFAAARGSGERQSHSNWLGWPKSA